MSIKKQLPILANNHLTKLANFGEENNDSKALYPLALKAIYGTMGSCNYELKKMDLKPLSWEFISAVKAQEVIQGWYKYTPAECVQVQRNMESAKEAMARMAKRVYEEMLGSERGEELLAKAKEYNIPYDEGCINWLELIDLVEEYEALLLQADEYNIAWDLSYYDPIGLQQEIEYCIRSGIAETRDLYRDYFDSRL